MLQEVTLSQQQKTVEVTTDGVDDVVIVCNGMTSLNTTFGTRLFFDNYNDYIQYVRAFSLSDTTPKNMYLATVRESNDVWVTNLGGEYKDNTVNYYEKKYDDKIKKIRVFVGGSNYITAGTFKIYGRRRY